ncbi:unnamed protein product [Didymodactylos carnosus]|uniref:PARP catalytic domain-containing protein n=1 Tax=Didymodactylos carnosus TaxID=1234261 RepID=A0A815U7V4_9BILA|nr:unnamed protein product [Didymodactylos carnosus]CAF4376970.1 unnamed protein product [Didymodactylos carnosus]
MLEAVTSSLTITLHNGEQTSLYKELYDEKYLDKWTKELGLKYKLQMMKFRCAKIEIWGPHFEQGQLLKNVADYWDNFIQHYKLIQLDVVTACLFHRKNGAAQAKLKEIKERWEQMNAQIEYIFFSKKNYVQGHTGLGIDLCPFENCRAIIIKESSYNRCMNCLKMVCVNCKVAEDKLHENRNCEQYQTEKQRLKELARAKEQLENIYKILYQKAEEFVQANWPLDMPKMTRADINPGLAHNCPAAQLFIKGVQSLNIDPTQIFEGGHCSWHGTSEQAIEPICHNGFDPSKRTGQAYGRGEYFGMTANVSRGFCKDSTRLIVIFLLRGTHYSVHGEYCYVIDNPINWDIAYCVPTLIVTFEPEKVLRRL